MNLTTLAAFSRAVERVNYMKSLLWGFLFLPTQPLRRHCVRHAQRAFINSNVLIAGSHRIKALQGQKDMSQQGPRWLQVVLTAPTGRVEHCLLYTSDAADE